MEISEKFLEEIPGTIPGEISMEISGKIPREVFWYISKETNGEILGRIPNKKCTGVITGVIIYNTCT